MGNGWIWISYERKALEETEAHTWDYVATVA